MPAHVQDYTTEAEVLSFMNTARDEIKAEFAILDKALKAKDLRLADDKLNRIWVQANWVRDLSGAFIENRPRTVKARLDYLKQYVHSDYWRDKNASERAEELAKLEGAPAKKAKAPAKRKAKA